MSPTFQPTLSARLGVGSGERCFYRRINEAAGEVEIVTLPNIKLEAFIRPQKQKGVEESLKLKQNKRQLKQF